MRAKGLVTNLWRDQVLVVRIDELGPLLPTVPPHQGLKVGIQLNPVLVQVGVQLVRAQNLKPSIRGDLLTGVELQGTGCILVS
jgi:hypothetical protein